MTTTQTYLQMQQLVGQQLLDLALSSLTGTELYSQIIEILLQSSFSTNASQYRPYLSVSMAEMDSRLQIEGASLKIAIEAPMSARILSAKDLRRGSEKKRNELRQLFETALVSLLFVSIIRNDPKISHLVPQGFFLFRSFEEVSSAYSHHKVKRVFPFNVGPIDDIEKEKLLLFANLAKVTLLLMPLPKKAILLELVTKVAENGSVRYVCGNGQTPFVSRRVAIYEVTADIPPPSRPFRSVFRKQKTIDEDEDSEGDQNEEDCEDYEEDTSSRTFSEHDSNGSSYQFNPTQADFSTSYRSFNASCLPYEQPNQNNQQYMQSGSSYDPYNYQFQYQQADYPCTTEYFAQAEGLNLLPEDNNSFHGHGAMTKTSLLGNNLSMFAAALDDAAWANFMNSDTYRGNNCFEHSHGQGQQLSFLMGCDEDDMLTSDHVSPRCKKRHTSGFDADTWLDDFPLSVNYI